jgi:hypothetical protein
MDTETLGNCRLCGQRRPLKNSHIWSAFAYKSFVSDQSKGGLFVDLCAKRMRPTNRQHKARWFCGDCEQVIGRFETYASPLCDHILENGIGQEYAYDERLLGFFTSMSFRMVHFIFDGKQIDRNFLPSLKTWRHFLLGKKKDVGPYSQHGFIVLGTDGPGVMSGNVASDKGFVVSRLGPFIIVGLLTGRKGMALSKIKIHDHSKIHAKGGTIRPITEFLVGDRLPHNNITMDVMRYLVEERGEMFKRLLAFKDKNPEYWKQQENRAKQSP